MKKTPTYLVQRQPVPQQMPTISVNPRIADALSRPFVTSYEYPGGQAPTFPAPKNNRKGRLMGMSPGLNPGWRGM